MARHLLQDLRYKISKRISDFIARTFFEEKLNNWLGYFCVALLACFYGVLESADLTSGIALFSILVSVLLITIFFTNPTFCFYFYLIFGFWIYFFNSFLFRGLFPVGTLYDALAICCLLGLMFSRLDFKDRLQQFSKIPLVQYFVVLLFYYIMEMFNPNAGGPSATAFTGLRKFIDFIIILLTAYLLLNSMDKIRKFSRILLIAAGISALYGCIQQWHGIFPWDMEQIMADQNSFNLLFVNGELRKFGTMADPTEYGLMMTACALYFFVISLNEKNKTWRNIYFVNIILMVLALGYSGTRTAYASLIAGLGFFILLNIDKRPIRFLAIIATAIFLFLMYAPIYSIAPIRRFRTTFIGSKDQSYKVRMDARAYIQPYIRSHPIGGGLGTTGMNGAREHPGHPLANFQPDGTYVTKATETGYIGLALTCILYFMTMRVGIIGFFQARHSQTKVYYSACLSALFSLYLAEYTQPAIGGVCNSLFYFPVIAIMLNLKNIDRDDSAAQLA
jgi:hypothetical protein